MKFPKPMVVDPCPRPLRIAAVYSRTPLPMLRADQLTVAHVLAFLKARGHQVDLYCINAGGKANSEELQWLQQTCRNVHFYRHGLVAIAKGLLKSVLRGIPVQVGIFSDAEQAADIRRAVEAGSYDLVYTYYVRSAEAVAGLGRDSKGDAVDQRPVTFLALQLSQTLNTQRIAKNSPNFFYKAFYAVESRLMLKYEARIWQKFTRTVLIGVKDYEAIKEACLLESQPVIDNHVFAAHGTDIDRIDRILSAPEKQDHLVFCGVMRTPTNIQAVQWFAANVWPLIRAKRPNVTWSIVGRDPSSEVQKLAALPGVVVTGTVDDPTTYLAEATVCINPMQAGGGMQNKLIEYLACAKAVVATTVANEGIGATHGEHLQLCDTPEVFANAVLAYLDDPSLRKRLGQAARAFIVDRWTWERHFLSLEEAFLQAVNAADTRTASAGQR